MAKLSTLIVLLAAILAASAVSARFTVTTTVVEENPGRQEGRCEEQVRKQHNFNMCHKFLMEHGQGGGSYGIGLEMVTDGENPQRKEQDLKECCSQMENVPEDCRCEGLRMMMSGQQHGQQQHEMMRQAQSLPQMCNISPRTCHFESVFY